MSVLQTGTGPVHSRRTDLRTGCVDALRTLTQRNIGLGSILTPNRRCVKDPNPEN